MLFSAPSTRSFAPIRTYKMPFQVESAAYCPQRGRFAAGGSDMWPRLFDAASGDELGALLNGIAIKN